MVFRDLGSTLNYLSAYCNHNAIRNICTREKCASLMNVIISRVICLFDIQKILIQVYCAAARNNTITVNLVVKQLLLYMIHFVRCCFLVGVN